MKMNWYENLNEYFPKEEMKSQEHIELLLEGDKDYYKDASKNHVLLYVEKDDFIFIDYLYVSGKTRGNGIGKKLLDKLKLKGKPIYLEVEPVDENEEDTEKRLRFYKREGFQHANTVSYVKNSLATGEKVELEILYWSPDPTVRDEDVLRSMQEVYRDIHTYKDRELYGSEYIKTEEALKLKVNKKDILHEVKN